MDLRKFCFILKVFKVCSLQYSAIVYMSLYDALYLYGLALRDVYEETKSEEIYKDGERIWKKMADRQFEGIL